MLILRTSPASPFGRKVRIAAIHLGLADRIEISQTSTTDPADPIRRENPLGKIPALRLEDGTSLYDSPVIAEYLDHLAGGGKIIPHGEARFVPLRQQALADGIVEAAVLQVYEHRFRPEEKVHAPWLALQAEKVSRSLDALEADLPGDDVDIGTIAVACALGYLDFRFAGEWRATHPRLVAWFDGFTGRLPAFAETMPA